MTRDLLAIFEQTAAQRAQDAHRKLVAAAIRPVGYEPLSDDDLSRIDEFRRNYARERCRHDIWLERRLRAAEPL